MLKDHVHVEEVTVSAAQASAGITITCGFVPRVVRILNETTGAAIEWFSTMPDAAMFTHSTEAAAGAYATSGGITKVTGDIDDVPGFSLAAGLCTEDDVLQIYAQR